VFDLKLIKVTAAKQEQGVYCSMVRNGVCLRTTKKSQRQPKLTYSYLVAVPILFTFALVVAIAVGAVAFAVGAVA
jgi:hypothetical protein